MSRLPIALITLALLLPPGTAPAQETPEEDPFLTVLFTAEEIMLHRRAIALNDEQRDAITRLIEDLQGRAVALQWRLLDETQSLKEVLEQPRVDRDRAIDRFNRVMELETEIKRVHLDLLVRIKNILTPEQQETLLRLRGEGDAPTG